MTLAERIDELVAQHGSLRALAQAMEWVGTSRPGGHFAVAIRGRNAT